MNLQDLERINSQTGIPVERGCQASKQGGCFCTGKCREIVGYYKNGIFEPSKVEPYQGLMNNSSPNPFNNNP